MKDDEIVTLGKNADAYANNQTSDSFDWKLIRDARFAQLVAAAEREAIAEGIEKLVDQKVKKLWGDSTTRIEHFSNFIPPNLTEINP